MRLCKNATYPTRWKGTRAPPVIGVADGGKMDTNESRRRLSVSTSSLGRGAQEDKKQRTSERRMKLLAR